MGATKEVTLFCFMAGVIGQMERSGRYGTVKNYRSTFNSFKRFRAGRDIPLREVDAELINQYEVYLREQGLIRNSSSFYMRTLRAVYNRAVRLRIVVQQYPFANVYTGVDKTKKRAVPLHILQRMIRLRLPAGSVLELARDIYVFSFLACGMSPIDIAHLKVSDLHHGILAYRRRKTGQLIAIPWKKCMQEIVDRHHVKGSPFLFPILQESDKDLRLQYQSRMALITRKLKQLGTMLGVEIALTMYTARHSWASIANNEEISIVAISACLGHTSERTTRIYLDRLGASVIGKANTIVHNALFQRKEKRKGRRRNVNLFVRD